MTCPVFGKKYFLIAGLMLLILTAGGIPSFLTQMGQRKKTSAFLTKDKLPLFDRSWVSLLQPQVQRYRQPSSELAISPSTAAALLVG
jgi:hypothetical protein